MHRCTCEGQRTICGFSTMWVLGTQQRSLDLEASALLCWSSHWSNLPFCYCIHSFCITMVLIPLFSGRNNHGNLYLITPWNSRLEHRAFDILNPSKKIQAVYIVLIARYLSLLQLSYKRLRSVGMWLFVLVLLFLCLWPLPLPQIVIFQTWK